MANTVKGTVSLDVLAKRYGVDRSTISRDWKARGFNIKASEEDIDAWVYENYLKPRLHTNIKEELQKETIRLTRAKADLAEQEAQQLAGVLVNADEVTEYLTQYLFQMKNAIRSIPAGVYLELAECETPLEMRQVLLEKIDSVLMDLGQFKYEEDRTDSTESTTSSTATKED